VSGSRQTRHTLLRRACDPCDEEAWGEFVERYRHFIFHVLKEIGVDYDDVEDLCQQILLTLTRDLPGYDRSKAKFRAWLGSVIRHAALAHIRKQRRNHRQLAEYLRETGHGPAASVPELEALIEQEWVTYIATMALDRVRKVFCGRAVDVFELGLQGLPAAEISERTGLAVSSVYTLRKRVKKRLYLEVRAITSELGLDDAGIEALCPSYIELSEIDVRYRDGTLLGKGAVKDVFRTYDSRAKRWVAMARLREDRGPEFYDLFVHEGWLTSSLSHPNIIKIYDVGVDGEGRPFFTMDLKGNTTLADLAGSDRETDRRTLLGIFLQVCDAVAYAHSRNIVHLDLKPENIQAEDFGEVLVCDWGLGKQLGPDNEAEAGEVEHPACLPQFDNMTLVGEIKGTPGFMAPEQVVEGAAKDQRTDIFALGCLLHLILAGQAPFTGSTERILEDTARGRVVPPRRRYPRHNIPESLEAVAMKALARQPADRYATVRELRDEIDHYLRGYATRAEHPGFFREARLFLTRNKAPARGGRPGTRSRRPVRLEGRRLLLPLPRRDGAIPAGEGGAGRTTGHLGQQPEEPRHFRQPRPDRPRGPPARHPGSGA